MLVAFERQQVENLKKRLRSSLDIEKLEKAFSKWAQKQIIIYDIALKLELAILSMKIYIY